MIERFLTLLAAGALAVSLGGCSSAAGSSTGCARGSDCASGVCGGDGVCTPAGEGGAGGEAGAGGEGGAGGDAGAGGDGGAAGGAGSGQGGAGAGGGTSGICSPNQDGVITRDETPLITGAKATYRRANSAPVDTAGKSVNGTKTWDFSGMIAGDHSALVETLPVQGQWFSDKFAGASYALRLSDTSDLLGVFQATDTALVLMGVVSPTKGTDYTELTYSPPAKILSFPIKMGSTWTTTSQVSGYAPSVAGFASSPVFYTEAYDSKVDAAGVVKTPLSTFPSMRVNTQLTRTVGLLVTTTRTLVFLSECYSTVAKVVSASNETAAEFSKADELSRLSP
jgi:hypothetical protein